MAYFQAWILTRLVSSKLVSSMVEINLPSFAKINLNLFVLEKRDDGFHEIDSIMQTISLADDINFMESESGIQLEISGASLPADENNLVIKAARLLADHCKVKNGAKICLTKTIPVGAGLGGGSSNAAAALIGLNRLWNLRLSVNELCELGTQLGSDVPFFFNGGTCRITGRGEKIEQISDVSGIYLIIWPAVSVSTGEAYKWLSERRKARSETALSDLTSSVENNNLTVYRSNDGIMDSNGFQLFNDFESIVSERLPQISEARQILLDAGAVTALMSGSGSTVFGIFENEETRQKAAEQIRCKPDWRFFAVTGLTRDYYRGRLSLDK